MFETYVRARALRSAVAVALVTTLFATRASAEPMLTLDPTIGVGGGLTRGGVRAHYGVHSSLMFGPRADEKEWTFPVGVYLSGGADSNGNGVGSIGLTVAALGAPSTEATPFVLSLGLLGAERDDGKSHLGTLVHASWGIWGPPDWFYKAVSAAVFVDVRTLFAGDGLPTENQLVVGLQLNPVAAIVGLVVGVMAASGSPHNHL